MPDECARGPDELALCTARDQVDNQAKLLRCHRLTRAGQGQPCTITLTRNGSLEGMTSTLGGGTVPDTSSYCDLRDGLVCDLGDQHCRPLPQLGDSCATRPYCPRGSFCDAGRCAPGLPVGTNCQAVLDFSEQAQCALGAHCDISMNTCVPAAADGEKCDYFAQCTSGVCTDGTCAPAGRCSQ